MNMMILTHEPNDLIRKQKFEAPMIPANRRPRDPNGRVGSFEDMDTTEAAALLAAMDAACAQL